MKLFCLMMYQRFYLPDRNKFQQAEKLYAAAKVEANTLQTMYEAAFEKLMELEEKV